ncbi:30S ribosomal protein S9 [Candidatus Nomurabacteria bacterium]|nr:30S ribosomal protein S9 [Candidatus Nomurabacteria bacterium]MCB9820675.1 30S ribosomal protein S9 [Candidatus Nomurabacteria bacterium]
MSTKDKKYIEAVGRRKTSIARVRITESSKLDFTINDKKLDEYFKTDMLRSTVQEPFSKTGIPSTYSVSVKVIGGGVSSQAEAIRHGISRALVKETAENRKDLKKVGLLKRDPRTKERRKFGLKKARKSAQWSKR